MNRKTANFLIGGIVCVLPMQSREVIAFNDEWLFKKAKNLPQQSSNTWEPVNIPHTWNAEDMQVQKNNQPFVIVIRLKEIDKKNREAYQQAII
jgi:hypothetical protein